MFCSFELTSLPHRGPGYGWRRLSACPTTASRKTGYRGRERESWWVRLHPCARALEGRKRGTHTHTHTHMYIYIYIHAVGETAESEREKSEQNGDWVLRRFGASAGEERYTQREGLINFIKFYGFLNVYARLVRISVSSTVELPWFLLQYLCFFRIVQRFASRHIRPIIRV